MIPAPLIVVGTFAGLWVADKASHASGGATHDAPSEFNTWLNPGNKPMVGNGPSNTTADVLNVWKLSSESFMKQGMSSDWWGWGHGGGDSNSYASTGGASDISGDDK